MSTAALRPLRRPRLWLWLWILALAAGLALCVLPLPAVAVPRGFDKIEHALGYFVLGAYATNLFARGRALAFALLGLLAFGAMIEGIQALVPWRSAELMDWLANAVGVALGGVLAFTPLATLLQRFDQRLP